MPSSRPILRPRFRALAAALLALAMAATPVFAVKPYHYQGYKQPKAPLKEGKGMHLTKKPLTRLKQGPSHAISRGGVAPQYHRPHWSWGTLSNR
jgi:hypothetical protein